MRAGGRKKFKSHLEKAEGGKREWELRSSSSSAQRVGALSGKWRSRAGSGGAKGALRLKTVEG